MKDETEPRPRPDEVTETGLESFPASDPPAFNQRGASRDADETAREHAEAGERETPQSEHAQHAAGRATEAPMPDPVRQRRLGPVLINVTLAVLVVLALLWLVI